MILEIYAEEDSDDETVISDDTVCDDTTTVDSVFIA